MMGFVSARDCQDIEDVDADCQIIVYVVNNTNQAQEFTDANCTISTYNETGDSVDSSVSMSQGELGTARYNWTFSKTDLGIWNYDVLCQKEGLSIRLSSIITVNESVITRLQDIDDITILIDNNLDTTFNTIEDLNVSIDATGNLSHGTGLYNIDNSDLIKNVNTSLFDHISNINSSILTAGFSTHNETDVWFVNGTINFPLNGTWPSLMGEFVYYTYLGGTFGY